jgi:hypothetical protein
MTKDAKTAAAIDSIAAGFARWAVDVYWDRLPSATRTMARAETLDILGDMFGGQALLNSSPFLGAIRLWSGDRGVCSVIDGSRLPSGSRGHD